MISTVCSALDHGEAARAYIKGLVDCQNATKKLVSVPLCYPCAIDGAHGKKLIRDSAFSVWLSCSWCRMAGGDLESFVSWVSKQRFAKTGWG